MPNHQPRPNRKRFALFFSLTLLTLFLFPFTIVPVRPPNRNTNPNPRPVRLAYLLTGDAGDGRRLRRLLRALYHPHNFYLIQLDPHASIQERADLEETVLSEPVMREYGNVRVMERGCHVSAKGPTVVSCVLHGAAVLIKDYDGWNWFINLDASDYPLMSQDDILRIFSYLPRDLNFIQHTSDTLKEQERLRPIIVDPALYIPNKTEVILSKEKRSLPSSFKIFVGSPRVVLTRSFLQFCIMGWDNFPRTLLLYYSNFLSSSESYFHSVACNSNYFRNTTVNHDLHFVSNLSSIHFDSMAESGVPFGHALAMDDPVLERIDAELLGRRLGRVAPGGWCLGGTRFGSDPCLVYGLKSVIRPSLRSRKLERLLVGLLDKEHFRAKQCK